MKKINIEFIEHSAQRYPTCGDYWLDENGDLQIRISIMSDLRSILAVAIHELFEVSGVIANGISIEAIDQFDIEFEKNRQPGNTDEPGHDPAAPYGHLHRLAEISEMLYADAVDLNWREHERNVNEL